MITLYFATLFKALGENTRIRIVKLLSIKPMYVCELESILQISQPRISQHLRILKHADLLHAHKEGQRTIYSLNQQKFDTLGHAFQQFLTKPLEDLPEFEMEIQRIEAVSKDPAIAICKNQGKVPTTIPAKK
ncbi:transcriptional regulator, ArsR family [Tindallia magadiensis]|uniref:Transcriptional regulator, ArsR family n=1 Tax=Tindallia magadiensis TaxID=69895 RepID=A0A1I3DSX2_9FIRM|nr:metalloregulator ArsR/SmtB family transcription factor [Tindallia magadiensis]SFH89763.1 transcriptional regulator, ArsR family [Tindallia magadiensis]